jgi:hypothetical protein
MRPRLLAAATLLGRFLSWWLAELTACARDLFALIAPTWSRSLSVFVEDGRLRLYDGRSQLQDPIIDVPCEKLGAVLPETASAQLADALKGGGRVRVVVNTDKAFIRRLRLPIAALPHLKSAIALQLPKLAPLDVSQLLTAFELVGVESTVGLIDLAILKRTDVDPLMSRLGAAGLRVVSIHLASAPEAKPRFRFGSVDLSGREPTFRRADRILIGAAATLGLACAALAATESYRAERALESAKLQTRVAASAALGRRQLLLSKLEPLSAMSEVESAPTVAALLAELTVLVPHDTWITTFEIKEHRLRLVGISPDSAALVRFLSGSGQLNDVELRSSMSAGIGTGKDRFEIAAEARAKPP